MTTPPPLLYDQYYHIFNRGNNRENIFIEERNYHYFLELYAHHIAPVAETYAYCLLRNHFHLLVRIKSEARNPDLSGFRNPKGLVAQPAVRQLLQCLCQGHQPGLPAHWQFVPKAFWSCVGNRQYTFIPPCTLYPLQSAETQFCRRLSKVALFFISCSYFGKAHPINAMNI